MKRVAILSALVFVVCIALAGCGQKSKPRNEVRDVTILVYIDRSASIKGYPCGGLNGIRRDYQGVCQGYVKKILQMRDGVHVEARAFVREEVTLFSLTANKWEQVRCGLKRAIAVPPYVKGEANKTLFSSLLQNIHNSCKRQKNRDFYVLVLTDGHPDEPFEKIRASALDFAKDNPGNMKSLLIAPVQPDMRYRWREKLADALSPLGESAEVANAQDYCGAAANAIKTLEEDK